MIVCLLVVPFVKKMYSILLIYVYIFCLCLNSLELLSLSSTNVSFYNATWNLHEERKT